MRGHRSSGGADLPIVLVFAATCLLVNPGVGAAQAPSPTPSAPPSPSPAPLGFEPFPFAPGSTAAPGGLAWAGVVEPFATEDRRLGLLTPWAGGFAALETTGVPDDDYRARALWVSADGIAWRRSKLPGGMRDLWRLVPFRDGLVAAVKGGPRSYDSIDLRLWRSADGIRWRRAGSLAPRPPAGLKPPWRMYATDLLTAAGRLVVLGMLTHSSGSGGWSPSGWHYASGRRRTSPLSDRLLGWTSRDGARWVQRRLSGALRHGIGGTVGSVSDTAGRLLAVRLGGYREGAVLSSEDGLDWSVAAPLPDAHEDGGSEGLIAPGDSVMVFADHADWGDGDYGNRLGGWRLEADGTWDEVIYRKPAVITSQVAEGDTVIVTGLGWDHARQWAWTLVSYDGGRTWNDGSSWTGANGSCLGDVAIRRGVAVMVGCDPTQPALWAATLGGS